MDQAQKIAAELDRIAAKHTCSKSFEDLAGQMKRGYVPTLRTDRLRGKARAEVLRLRAAVRAAGFRCFPEVAPGEEAS